MKANSNTLGLSSPKKFKVKVVKTASKAAPDAKAADGLPRADSGQPKVADAPNFADVPAVDLSNIGGEDDDDEKEYYRRLAAKNSGTAAGAEVGAALAARLANRTGATPLASPPPVMASPFATGYTGTRRQVSRQVVQRPLTVNTTRKGLAPPPAPGIPVVTAAAPSPSPVVVIVDAPVGSLPSSAAPSVPSLPPSPPAAAPAAAPSPAVPEPAEVEIAVGPPVFPPETKPSEADVFE